MLDDKHCLNSVTVSVLIIKLVCAECFLKMLVYLLQSMADMRFFAGVDLLTLWRPGAYR